MILDPAAILLHFERFEGRTHQMYSCSSGRVTVGIGHMVASREEAEKLQFGAAAPAEIGAEWDRVAAMEPGRMAQYYRRDGQPLMHDAEIRRLFWLDIERLRTALRAAIREYEALPPPIQLALLDMIFTLGPTEFVRYKRMISYIRARDFRRASTECARRGIPERGDRHRSIRTLFESP